MCGRDWVNRLRAGVQVAAGNSAWQVNKLSVIKLRCVLFGIFNVHNIICVIFDETILI